MRALSHGGQDSLQQLPRLREPVHLLSEVVRKLGHAQDVALGGQRSEDKGRAHPCLIITVYSRASDNGPSEKRTTSLQRTSAVLPIEFSIVIVH